MTASPAASAASQRYNLPLMLGLVGAGLAGNYFKFPIFLSIDFLFGSIFAMLALQLCGVWRGTLAAALIAGMTYLLWHHPYAIVIMTAEVLVVGLLMTRRQMGMLTADALYWLLLGMPLVYVFYHLVMGVPNSNAFITMTKQAVNGVANALLARMLFAAVSTRLRPGQVSLHELLGNLLTAFLLFPALTFLAVGSRADFTEIDHQIRSGLSQDSKVISNELDQWLQDRTRVVVYLSKQAASLTPQQMQLRLEQARAADGNFQRIGLRVALPDGRSLITAYAPAVDASSHANIGKVFVDRDYIATLRATLKPMLAEIVPGRIDQPEPIAMVFSPVLTQGTYTGYVNAVLQLDQVHRSLDIHASGNTLFYTLLDRHGSVILSNRPEQKTMQPFVRGKGTLQPVDADVSQWLPTLPPNTSISDQWRSSTYVIPSRVGEADGWQLLLEQPVALFQKQLYDSYANKLALLLLILLGTLLVANLLSRRAIASLERLGAATHALADNVAHHQPVVWPHSNITQISQLIDNFKAMTASLAQQFQAVERFNSTLEQRIQQRTAALAQSEAKHRALVDNSHDIIYTLDAQGVFTFVSASWTHLLGHPVSSVQGHSFAPLVHPEDLPRCQAALQAVFARRERQTDLEYRVRHQDGSWRWHSSNALPLMDEQGGVIGFEGIAKDITEHKALEDQVHQMAFYDPLTNLPNRRLLTDRLGMAMAASQRSGCFGALLFLDLDNFKPLNDVYGHDLGDLLLQEVARRLSACVRGMDTVARFGGDEFVVVLSELEPDRAASLAQAKAVAEKIRLALAQPYQLVQRLGHAERVVEHHCSASIGAVLFVDNQLSQDEILKRADAAMYQAKAGGRNTAQFYELRDEVDIT